ncbi:DUF4350 domain-containing protein [Neolewinella lacunae]|uniref:DUF4350 domain-containing protein n=1 Tax=Neolewinella lacunae TaxID=1517758 RepID=A0A923PMH4_9BACT|nr:DUF4350 domain-containing protein [Neolewinella lacunae]MBC6994396.1 DUF4350 domain-containing protein [Neolewinella lacunae]MDN3633327.1 DUF4350 domain-containing protein [Neolewinella lacunae]
MLKRALWYGIVALGLLSFYGCPSDWSETYRIKKKNPYDLYVLHQLLSARPEGLITIEDSLSILNNVSAPKSNYVFVGNYAYYNERAITELLAFVEKGNTAFIATHELPEDLAAHLFGNDCYYGVYDYQADHDNFLYLDTARLRVSAGTQEYELIQVWNNRPSPRATYYIQEEYLCDPEIDNEALGTLNAGYTNYVRLSWGEGNFYFLSTPIFLTNYFLVDSARYGYGADALAVLGDGPVYWDEFSRVPPSVARQRDQQTQRNRNYSGGRNLLQGNEALRYIQEQAPLALAWYTLVAAAILFVLFRGKRRQRIIPIIRRRENSSKRFIDTISRLVYQKGNHSALARQELASLRFYLQDRFGVRWKEDEPPPLNLSELIGAPPEVAKLALTEIRMAQKQKFLGEHQLVRFYRAIEPLYKL